MSIDKLQKTILLVEDEAIIAMSEAAMLEKYGYRVITVHSGEKAIETARNQAVALILMDIDLGWGKMDGTEAAELILERHDIPVVFLSSHTEPEVVEKTEGITSYGYIVKTSGETVLIASIKMAFRLFDAKIREREKDVLLRKSEHKFRDIFDSTSDAIFIHDMEGLFLEVNDRACSSLGYTREELLSMTPVDIDTPESADKVRERLGIIEGEGQLVFEAVQRRKDGSLFPVEINSRRIDYEGRDCIISVVRDITELRKVEKQYRLLAENSSDVIVLFDGNFSPLYISPSSAELSGYTLEDFKEKSVFEIVHPDDLSTLKANIQTSIEEHLEKRSDSFRIYAKNGDIKWIEVKTMLMYDEAGNLSAVIVNERDISDRIRIEKQLRYILKHDPNAIAVYDKDLNYIIASDRYKKDYGIEGESLAGKHHYEIFPEVPKRWRDIHARVLQGEILRNDNDSFIRDDGSITYNSWECRPWYTVNGEIGGMITYTEVITDRVLAEKALRESESRLQTILDKLPVPIVISKGEAEKVVSINDKFVETFGYSIEDMPDVEAWWKLAYPDAEYRAQIREEWKEQLRIADEENSEIEPVSAYITCKDGTVRYVSVRAYSFEEYHLVVLVDLTEINELHKHLEKSLEEKQFLMKELNHRLKNNLAMVSSLIHLKSSTLMDVVDLSDLARQVDAVRLIHEKLYQSEETTHIDFGSYVRDLLSTVFSFSRYPVKTVNTVPSIMIPARTAIPLGLIINEIATNAVKHGFTASGEWIFTAALEDGDERDDYKLILSNNGNPFPETIRLENPDTLGLMLIQALVDQIKGSLELQKTPHPVFTVRFHAGPA